MTRAVSLISVLLLLAGAWGCANRRPASSLAARLTRPGFSVARPPNDNWYLDLSERNRQPEAVIFRRDVPDEAKNLVFVVRFFDFYEEPRSDDEFLAVLRRVSARAITPEGARLRSYQLLPERADGRYCVRFTMKTTESANQDDPSTLFHTRTSGLFCRHPDYPRSALFAAYAERGFRDEFDEALASEGEVLLRSLRIEVAVRPGSHPDDALASRYFHFADVPPDSEGEDEIRAMPLFRELDQLDREGGWPAAGARLVEIRSDPEHLDTYALWLRDRYMFGPAPEALYGLHYFDALIDLCQAAGCDPFGASLHDTMLIMVYVSSELLAHENVARCAEQPNGTNYRLSWKTGRERGAYARRIWDKMTTERQVFALRFAKARVESAEGRPPSAQACATGMRAMMAAMDAGLCKRTPASELPDSGYIGGSAGTFMACDSARFATFVDDETWVERRETLRDQYWQALFSDPIGVPELERGVGRD